MSPDRVSPFALPARRTSRSAVIALVLAAIAFFSLQQLAFASALAFACSLAVGALFLGIAALRDIRRQPSYLKGKAFAWSGIVISVLVLALGGFAVYANILFKKRIGQMVPLFAQRLGAHEFDALRELGTDDFREKFSRDELARRARRIEEAMGPFVALASPTLEPLEAPSSDDDGPRLITGAYAFTYERGDVTFRIGFTPDFRDPRIGDFSYTLPGAETAPTTRSAGKSQPPAPAIAPAGVAPK